MNAGNDPLTQLASRVLDLEAELARCREALKRIANINSAIQHPTRNTSYSDYELRAIAREALTAPLGVEALESWRGE